MFLITGINSFGRISKFKVNPAFKARQFLKNGSALFVSSAGIYSGFINYIIAFFKDLANRSCCRKQRMEIRQIVLINWRGYSHNMKTCLFENIQIIGKNHISSLECLRLQLIAGINTLFHKFNTFGIDIKANYPDFFSKSQSNRETDIS